eukprot:2982381-Rhodomonas_salina.1
MGHFHAARAIIMMGHLHKTGHHCNGVQVATQARVRFRGLCIEGSPWYKQSKCPGGGGMSTGIRNTTM